MNNMPLKLRETLNADPFMHQCIFDPKVSRVEWHHVWIYAGKQIQEWWAVVPLSLRRHRLGPDAFHCGNRDTIDRCRFVSLQRVIKSEGSLDSVVRKYPRFDWNKEFIRLNKKYG